MREILFRGKCVECGIYYKRWLEGFYGEDNGKFASNIHDNPELLEGED